MRENETTELACEIYYRCIFSYTRPSRICDAQPTTIRLFCDHEPLGHQLSTCAWQSCGCRRSRFLVSVTFSTSGAMLSISGWHKVNENRKTHLKVHESLETTSNKNTTGWLVFHSLSITTSLDVLNQVVVSSFGSYQAKRKTAIRLMLQRNVARIIASSLLTQHPNLHHF